MNRPDLCPLARAVVLDLLRDARCAYRDARHFPNSAPELVPYGDRCRVEARALRNGAPYRINRHGWPELLEA